jgi:hypothetical protein
MTPGAWESAQRTRPTAEQWAHEEWRRISGRRGTARDWALLVLAAASVALGAWFLLGPQEPYAGSRRDWQDRLLLADLVVCAVFVVSICLRWLPFRIGRRYLRRHWWEVPALVPFDLPLLDEHHWVAWLVLATRVVRLVDRADNILGDRITAALVEHFTDPIVDAIKRPITAAVLDEVVAVVRTGTYATNLRHAVHENRTELEAMIVELVREDRTAGRLRFVPFHDELVRSTTDTVLRILDRALEDPRMTELINDVIRNSATQLRAAVREQR